MAKQDFAFQHLNAEGIATTSSSFLSQRGPLYIDGSVLHSDREGVGSVAFAAMQLRRAHVGAPWAAFVGVAPAYLAPTAVAAERLALTLATVHLAADQQAQACTD